MSRLDIDAPIFIPSRQPSPPHILPGDHFSSDEDHYAIKARVLASYDRSTSTSDSGRDSPDADNLAQEYVQLKLRMSDLTAKRHLGHSLQIQDLKSRLEVIKKNYFFDEKEAEEMYRVERNRVETLALQARLRTPAPPVPSDKPKSKVMKQRPPKLQPTLTPTAVADIFDDDAEDSPTGLLDILDDIPTDETNNQGTTIAIRDMALPKHWSGRTPKVLLKEAVAKVDRYAAVTYDIISGHSRAKRASVSIRWDGRKMDEWSMEDIACHDEGQAEQYIATVALHVLTFPPTDGFATSTSAAPGSPTFFRLLPAVFRDLWDELEVLRKLNDDGINRRLWAKLRSIVEPKLEADGKVSV